MVHVCQVHIPLTGAADLWVLRVWVCWDLQDSAKLFSWLLSVVCKRFYYHTFLRWLAVGALHSRAEWLDKVSWISDCDCICEFVFSLYPLIHWLIEKKCLVWQNFVYFIYYLGWIINKRFFKKTLSVSVLLYRIKVLP